MDARPKNRLNWKFRNQADPRPSHWLQGSDKTILLTTKLSKLISVHFELSIIFIVKELCHFWIGIWSKIGWNNLQNRVLKCLRCPNIDLQVWNVFKFKSWSKAELAGFRLVWNFGNSWEEVVPASISWSGYMRIRIFRYSKVSVNLLIISQIFLCSSVLNSSKIQQLYWIFQQIET